MQATMQPDMTSIRKTYQGRPCITMMDFREKLTDEWRRWVADNCKKAIDADVFLLPWPEGRGPVSHVDGNGTVHVSRHDAENTALRAMADSGEYGFRGDDDPA